MSTLLTLAVLLSMAAGWHALKRRIKEGPRRPGRRTPSRKATMFAVMLVLGLQAIATAPAASAAACGEAPNPERPGAGMVGALDPPDGVHGEGFSPYRAYGYAGMVWDTFETDCGPLSGIGSPNSAIDTWAGNQLFSLGKNIVGATNSLHYTVLQGSLLSPLYNAVKAGADKIYNNIYAQLFGLVALIMSIMMFRNIWRGDLAAVSKRALYGLAAVWLAASSLALLRYLDPIDNAIVQTTTNIQAGFVDAGPPTAPPPQDPAQGQISCQNKGTTAGRPTWDILPTDLHCQIVYENWLRGEFGSATAPQAQQFGAPLLDARAFTWDQIQKGGDGDAGLVDAKKAAYKDISTKLGPATGYFTGEAGGRTGAGFLSLGQALVYSLFQLLAKASILLAQVLIRLFALTAPLIGLIALLQPQVLPRVLKVAGGVAFNLIVLSVLAGVHMLLLQAIFGAGNSLNMLTQMVLAGLITVLLFMVGRPVRRLWQMVEMSVSMVGAAVPSPSGGIFSRFRRNNNGPTPQDAFWQNVRETDDVVDGEQRGPMGATVGGGRFRPEATIFANAQRLDNNGTSASRPAAAWSGAWPGAIGGGSAGALPSGGRPGSPVYGQYNPAGGDPGEYVVVGAGGRPTVRGEESRRVDTSPVADRRWNDEPEPVVVPSDLRTPEADFSGYTPPEAPRAPGVRATPRRVDPEVVAGKPVFVLYRPSRGIEVREEPRDTDQVMGR
ncbi:magnesium transporter [Amycolatopsis sp. WQ 127309]|uniref:magnesium transporter n=1 Tax=Amycolatopsis sp. WQ 127309 TaxID=2932773 RepID=UPI001FF105B6|nr:magnesium transporter [Amycolatopsis sp. WQ 127309]UOZ10119.1 magnesium transporter [Amycolatopsis sp. WQ 127309]